MGRDNQPKHRQLHRTQNKAALRASYARILIVTEGGKTEPLYLGEICSAHRLHSANVEVQPGRKGTAPIQVVKYAKKLFEEGDEHRRIPPKSFDQVYAVFDRDEHDSYREALDLAESLDGHLRNDEKQSVSFKAIASIPSFELWLLLHYENIHAPIHRDEVMKRLKRHIPGYEKGAGGIFKRTIDLLTESMPRARALEKKFSARTDPKPFTALHQLVTLLITLRS